MCRRRSLATNRTPSAATATWYRLGAAPAECPECRAGGRKSTSRLLTRLPRRDAFPQMVDRDRLTALRREQAGQPGIRRPRVSVVKGMSSMPITKNAAVIASELPRPMALFMAPMAKVKPAPA